MRPTDTTELPGSARPLWRSRIDGLAAAALISATVTSIAAPSLAAPSVAAPSIAASGPAQPTTGLESVPLAVLGDSDSHSYQDLLAFPKGGSARGGRHRATTLQWLEILARLRPQYIDPGPWQVFGASRSWVADMWRWVGVPSRFPKKLDYRHNMALSGAECGDLLHGPRRQAPHLVTLMDRDPARWRKGIVVVRIGINELGDPDTLDSLARDPVGAPALQRISACTQAIAQSVALVRARHPQTRFVLVGIFNNAHWARNHHRWQAAQQQRNIDLALARFDDALLSLAAQDAQVAFFDDRRWFGDLWGGRAPDGSPDYRVVRLGRGLEVHNRDGDHPANATLADGHAGSAWNALWARALVTLMNERFGASIPPIEIHEFRNVLDPAGEFGM